MNSPHPKALLVDDTSMFRTLARNRLESVGIHCDEAATYDEAERQLSANEYAVLVTELHLPSRHPYHLVVDLLRRPNRPIIVVATNIREPRLAQHLFDLGVEEILFKPVDYSLLAMKLKVKATQWQEHWSPATDHAKHTVTQRSSLQGEAAVSSEELQTKLEHLTGMLPLSTTAFDVFTATRDDGFDAKQVEEAVAKESSLAVELLRLANSTAYNGSTDRVTSLDAAVVRVGRRKIGELALAHTAKTLLTQRIVPWLDIDLLWCRSIAASSAAELLQAADRSATSDGVVLPALMHGLGRVVLASLYPVEYERLLSECKESRESLDELETRTFPLSPGRVMARVLELWNLPKSVWGPLAHNSASSPHAPDSLLKSSLALGELAVGSWQDFDQVTLPGVSEMLDADRLESFLPQIVDRTAGMGGTAPHQTDSKAHSRIHYARVTSSVPDFLPLVLKSFSNVELIPLEGIAKTERVVIDCRAAAPYSLAPFVSERTFDPRRIIVADAAAANEFRRFGQVISMPLSFAALRHACVGEAGEQKAQARPVHPIPYQTPIAAAFDAQL